MKRTEAYAFTYRVDEDWEPRYQTLLDEVRQVNRYLRQNGLPNRLVTKKLGRWGKKNPAYRRGVSSDPVSEATRVDVYVHVAYDRRDLRPPYPHEEMDPKYDNAWQKQCNAAWEAQAQALRNYTCDKFRTNWHSFPSQCGR